MVVPSEVEAQIKKCSHIEIAIVLYDGTYDSVGVFTPDEALEYVKDLKEEWVWRELNV
jgi:hypothetical protein